MRFDIDYSVALRYFGKGGCDRLFLPSANIARQAIAIPSDRSLTTTVVK
ncbi:hypothetical protein [Nostoc sp.]